MKREDKYRKVLGWEMYDKNGDSEINFERECRKYETQKKPNDLY